LLERPDNGGRTALFWAIQCRHAAVVQLLLEYGANVHAHPNRMTHSARRDYRQSPWERAVEIQNWDALYWMIRLRPQLWHYLQPLLVQAKPPINTSEVASLQSTEKKGTPVLDNGEKGMSWLVSSLWKTWTNTRMGKRMQAATWLPHSWFNAFLPQFLFSFGKPRITHHSAHAKYVK